MKLKNIIYHLAAVLLPLGIATSCTPDEYSLGEVDVTSADLVEGTAYTITHDASNANIVYLKSLMSSSYQVTWVHPQGRSNQAEVTLEMPFAGTYSVVFGVETRGGVVYGDTATFTIDDFNSSLVDNELYTYLTGGAGNSKTWIPDNGTYGLCSGDISYGDPSLSVGLNNFTANWDPGANHQDGTGNFMKSSWTFDLQDGANVKSITYSSDGTYTEASGTFLLDTDNALLDLTDLDLLHSPNWDNRADQSGWRSGIHIITLNENQLRLCILRNAQTSGEGEWWLCFNFVSQEYAENYEVVETEETPTLDSDWLDFVQPKNDKVITYQLAGFDWYEPNGTAKGITSVTALSDIEYVTLELNSNDYSYTFTDINEDSYTGTYSLTDDGIYTFTPSLPTFDLSDDGRAQFKCNDDGTLRIMSFTQDDNCDAQTGALSTLTWGSREYDDQGDFVQYMGYEFEVVREGSVKTYAGTLNFFDTSWNFQTSSTVYVTDGVDADYTFTIEGSSSAPYGIYLDIVKLLKDHSNCDVAITDIKVDGSSIEFDDSIIDRGVGDAETTARRYILNPWGATAGDAANYIFSSSLAVTVHITMDNGTAFVSATE